MSKLTNMIAVAVGGFILAAALAPTAANAFTPRHDQISSRSRGPVVIGPQSTDPRHFSAPHRGGHFSKK